MSETILLYYENIKYSNALHLQSPDTCVLETSIYLSLDLMRTEFGVPIIK